MDRDAAVSSDFAEPDNSSKDVLDPTGTLAELAAILTSAQTLEMVLEDIAALAKDRISGADEVSVTLINDSRPSTVASTGSLATDLDERQYQANWGPCLDSAGTGQMLIVDDMATGTRWPDFRKRALEVGVHSSMSAPLPTQQDLGGALNIYARAPRAFGDPSRSMAQSFADHAALALAHAYRYSHVANQAKTLREAMQSRAVIEQAKGILMGARQIDADEAFNTLVRLSQAQHIKLRELAARIVTQASGHPVNLDERGPSGNG